MNSEDITDDDNDAGFRFQKTSERRKRTTKKTINTDKKKKNAIQDTAKDATANIVNDKAKDKETNKSAKGSNTCSVKEISSFKPLSLAKSGI